MNNFMPGTLVQPVSEFPLQCLNFDMKNRKFNAYYGTNDQVFIVLSSVFLVGSINHYVVGSSGLFWMFGVDLNECL